MTQFKRSHSVPLVFALVGALALGSMPTYAVAATSSDLQAQLDEAQKKLASLNKDAEVASGALAQVQYDLDQTNQKIDQVEKDIAEKQEKLDTVRGELSGVAASSYKSGKASLFNLVLGSDDFQSLISNVIYANKIADKQRDAIEQVVGLQNDLKKQQATLEAKQEEQEQLVTDQAQKAQAANSASAAQQSYVDGLSAEVKQALEQERLAKAEESRRQAEAAAKAAQEQQAQQQQQQGQQQGQQSSGGSNSTSSKPSGSNKPSGGSSSSSHASAVETAISYAQGCLGKPYASPANPPSTYDCSTLTRLAYASAGVSVGSSSRAQAANVKAKGNWVTSQGQLQRGDLVFYAQGGYIYHVALYLGGGSVIHANGYGNGVQVTGLFYDDGFIGGGSVF